MAGISITCLDHVRGKKWKNCGFSRLSHIYIYYIYIYVFIYIYIFIFIYWREFESQQEMDMFTGKCPLQDYRFMRLTPDSRTPAKADPSARSGFEFDPGGSHLGRGCAYLGLGWRHLGGFSFPGSPHLGRCWP